MTNLAKSAEKRVLALVVDEASALVEGRSVCVGCGLCGGHPAAQAPIQIGQSAPKKSEETAR